MNNLTARPLLLLLVLLVGLVACDKTKGCGGDSGAIPKTAEARVEQMVGKLPAKTDSAMVVSDLEEMRSTLGTLKERLPNTGVVESVQKQIQIQFGVDLLDAESWKRAGLAADTTAVGGVYRSRLIVMLYVENKQNFEKVMIEKAKKGFGIEAVTKNQTVGDLEMKVLSDDPAKQIAWLYQGKLALVSMPATDAMGALEDGSATLVLSEVAQTKKEQSLWAEAGFQSFKKALLDEYPIAVFLNSEAALASDAVKERISVDPNAAAASEWMKKNVTFVGLGIDAKGDQAQARAYVGLVPEVQKKAKAAMNVPTKHDWGGFATDKLLLGARLSLDVPKTYSLFLESLPEDQQRQAQRNVKMMGDRLSIDMEKDIFQALSGHVGLFFYGIAGNPLMLMSAKSAGDMASKVGLMLVLKFKEPADVDKLLAKVVASTGGAVSVRPFTNLPDDETFKVLSVAGQETIGNFFIHGDTVAFGTGAFGDDAMHKYLTDARDDKKLTEIEKMDLGKNFAAGDGYNGLYFSSNRALENLGSAAAMGGVGQILGALQEVGLTFDVDDVGGFAQLRVDLKPQPKSDKPADQPADKPADK